MSRVDWDRVHSQAIAELRDGETLRGLTPAISPPPTTGSGLFPSAAIVPVISLVLRWEWKRTSRRAGRESLFPLAPRMIVALTDHRLLVWTTGRRWNTKAFLGFVTLDRVVRADAPTVGQGWRTVNIYLANEPTVSLKVPGQRADAFAAALSGSTST